MNGKTLTLASGSSVTVAHDGDGGRVTLSVGSSAAHLTLEEATELVGELAGMVSHRTPKAAAEPAEKRYVSPSKLPPAAEPQADHSRGAKAAEDEHPHVKRPTARPPSR